MKHFYLTTEPWIPVRDIHGENRQVSLEKLFAEGGEITDLVLPPGQRIAVMRLLLAIVIRSLPLPENRVKWRQIKDEIGPHATVYLREWHDAFDLYGETPFLQAKGLETIDNSTLDKLDFSLASGNNHTLFDHEATQDGRFHTPNNQILLLLLTQNFSAGGTIGRNVWNGEKIDDKVGIASPALEGSPLHVFLLGQNILETLWLNLIPRNDLGTVEIGIPPWEKPPKNASEAQQFRSTLLGRLAPISRVIILPEDGNKTALAVGCKYAQIKEFIDPYLANELEQKTNKQQLKYLPVSSDHLFWRDLEGLLWLQTPNKNIMPPKNLKAIAECSPERKLTFWAGGVAVDKAKYEFTGEWRFDFQVGIYSSSLFWYRFQNFAKKAEEYYNAISYNIDNFWNLLDETRSDKENGKKTDKKSIHKRTSDFAKKEFWHRADVLAFKCISEVQADTIDKIFDEMEKALYSLAQEIFDDSIPKISARYLMVYAKTISIFRNKINSIKSTNTKEVENGTTE